MEVLSTYFNWLQSTYDIGETLQINLPFHERCSVQAVLFVVHGAVSLMPPRTRPHFISCRPPSLLKRNCNSAAICRQLCFPFFWMVG
jgi:hypothetical protein